MILKLASLQSLQSLRLNIWVLMVKHNILDDKKELSIMKVKKEEIKAMILQFPVEEINELIGEIRKALEIREFMKLA